MFLLWFFFFLIEQEKSSASASAWGFCSGWELSEMYLGILQYAQTELVLQKSRKQFIPDDQTV